MVYLPKDAVDLFEQGFGTDEIVRRKIRNAEGQPASSRTARRWRHEWNRRKASAESTTVPEEDKLYGLIKDKPVSLRTLSEMLDRSEKSVGDIIDGMISRGYNILREDRLVQATFAGHLEEALGWGCFRRRHSRRLTSRRRQRRFTALSGIPALRQLIILRRRIDFSVGFFG